MTKFHRRLWIGLFIMALFTPLGLLLPKKFAAGEAWGEWGTDKLAKLIGYVPEGLKELAGIWKAPLSAYNLGGENPSPAVQALWYVISGFLGILAGLATYLILRLIKKNEK